MPKAASIAYTCHVAAYLRDPNVAAYLRDPNVAAYLRDPNVAAYLRDAGRSITVRLGDADLRHTFNHFI
ncbi:MAG: hypothetical protein ABL921_19380, partial [Pirellula sp.]